jgi:predicted  nucleic acid-binding Zn-ribbon protein
MSLFNKVLGTVFEMPEEQSPPAGPTGTPAAVKPAHVPSSYSYAPPAPAEDDPMLLKLRAAAYARVTPFKTMLDSMDKMKGIIPDETMRAQAAYANVANDARTPTQILQAIDVHLQDLQAEQTKFVAITNSKKSADLQTIENDISIGNSGKAQLERDLTNLRQSVTDKEALLSQCILNINAAEDKKSSLDSTYSSVIASFDQAFTVVQNELTTKKVIFTNILSKG